MAKLLINRAYKRPAMQANESFFDMCKRIGTRYIKTMGTIGNGTKVHRLTLQVVDTDNGLGLVSVWSLCGSAKWNSYLTPHFDDTLECTCKRCNSEPKQTNMLARKEGPNA